jgi:hypothetical protein
MIHRLFLCLSAIMALAAALPAQEEEVGGELPAITGEQKTRLAALLPPADGKFTADPDEERQFLTSDLFELIDGGAPAYFEFGFVALVHAPCKAKGIGVSVDIYDMATPLQAFGIYAAERDADAKAVPVGAAGAAGETFLDFFQSRYYVKIESTGAKDKEMAGYLMRDAAEIVSKRIGNDKSFPKLLDLLPVADRLPLSRGYAPKAPLAMESLAPAIKADYRFEGKDGKAACTLWISMADDAKAARARAAALKKRMAAESVEDLPDLGPGAFRGKDEYTGVMVIVPQGPRVLILVNPPENPAPLVKACAEKACAKKTKTAD